MKTSLYTSSKGLSVLWVSILSLMGTSSFAQNTTGTASGSDILYYTFVGTILVVLLATIFIIQKATRVLDQYGQSLFQFDFPIFRIMANNSKIVAVVMALIVLLGIYFVVTYGMK